jgi:predicted cupin superfamily sugar epimerase
MDVATAVGQWRLGPHPEGGYFRETYRSPLTAVPPGWPGERSLVACVVTPGFDFQDFGMR